MKRTALLLSVVVLSAVAVAEGDATAAKVEGTLVGNGETVELPHVYVWRDAEGFFVETDPTWTILFVQQELSDSDLADRMWGGAFVEIQITETQVGDAVQRMVCSQSLQLSADSSRVLSGGTYPQFEIEGLGTDRISGRIFHHEEQEFFEDTYRYDLRFSAQLSIAHR